MPTTGGGLVRSFGPMDIFAATINAVIGAGIFGLPARIYGLVGDYSTVAFVVCGIFAGLIVICFAEVASRFHSTGGPYLYARETFGPTIGFETGWLMWVARVAAFAANANLLVSYAGYFSPGIGSGAGRNVVLAGVALMLVAINIVGVRSAARVNNFFTAGKLIPIALFIAAGLWSADWGRFTFAAVPAYPPFSNAVLLLVYAFTGFEMAVIPSGEIRDPRRTIPMSLVSAMAVIATIYLLIQIVCIATLPQLAASERPLAEAANRFLGPAGAAIISAGILVSITGNLHITLLSASRIPFAMGEQGDLPRFLAVTHPRFRTPHVAIFLTGAIMLTLAISGTFIYALTISTLARLTIYVTTCAALPVLRRKPAAPPALWQVPGGTAIAAAAVVLGLWLLSNSTWHEARDTAVAAIFGLLIFVVSRARLNSPTASPHRQ